MGWYSVKAQGNFTFINTVDEKCLQSLSGSLKGRDQLLELRIDGRIILQFILNT